ncbi:hypothetical protein [Shewanella algidipiscicola]|uniref:hypothetical protein n=1 Tax=Shewanella algidipiscicola TaxID=614070 RepID=UPI000D782715|nr:hypothetical protein [Shewanella algidipiscicola]
MLFPLNPNTPQCRVFEVLNSELLHFLEAAVQANSFNQDLFSQYQYDGQQKRSVCWSNMPTKEKFEALWRALEPLEQEPRRELFELVQNCQDIAVYFDDLGAPLPELEDDLFEVFKSLTSHLFTRTKDLSGARQQADSSIEQHFQEVRRENNNSQLCFLCGTSLLSQDRTNLDDDEQWRADYDHVLCKDKYPIYTVHPGNFIPTCHICNSKAKGAKNVLFGSQDQRRRAFYPLPPSQESCHQYACIEPSFRGLAEMHGGDWQDPIASAPISFPTAPADIAEKVNVWEEVYQVPSRVEEYVITHFFERLAGDLLLTDQDEFEGFSRQLQRAARIPADVKMTEWRFWLNRVYVFLDGQNEDYLRNIWPLLQWKLSLAKEDDMMATFG